MAAPSASVPATKRAFSILSVTTAAVLFALLIVTAKRAAVRLPAPQLALVRGAFGLLACGVISLRHRFVVHNWRALTLRGLLGAIAVYLYFLAVAHLPVGLATLLNYTYPVFTAVWAVLFLGEHLTPGGLAALGLTTTGVLLVITGTAPAGSLGLGPWQLVGLASAMFTGASVATIRELRKTDGTWEIFAAFCVASCVITAVPAARGWVAPDATEWLLLGGLGLLGVAAQGLLTYSLGYVTATGASILTQVTPVTAFALGWVLYGERMAGLALCGAAVTLAGVTLGAYRASAPAGTANPAATARAVPEVRRPRE